MIPLKLDVTKSTLMPCCSKSICNGCYHANLIHELEASLKPSCPFWRREPLPTTIEEADKQRMKRVEAGDPVALCKEGFDQYMKGDYKSAFDYFTKSAQLGDADGHFRLAFMYQDGHGVEKEEGTHMYHLEEAAIGGHPYANVWNGNMGFLREQ